MDKKIRIAYLSHTMSYGGATKSLLLLIRAIEREDYEKYFVIPNKISCLKLAQDVGLEQSRTIGLDLKHIHNNLAKKTSIFKFYLYKYYSVSSLIKVLKKNQIQILHVNSTVFSHIYKRIKGNLDIKIVTHVREMIPKFGSGKIQRYIIEQINNYSDAIIAISTNESVNFKDHKNLHVIANPIDFAEIDRVKNVNYSTVHVDNRVIVGMIGTFSAPKGNLEFVQALNYMIKNNLTKRDIIFRIVGSEKNYNSHLIKRLIKKLVKRENYYEKVIKYIHENGLGDYIEILPYTHKILEEINRIDIIVRPAKTGDPWGRDIIEAFALRKPVIATGTSDFYIIDGENGYLVPLNDPRTLGNKIVTLINDPSLRESFGTLGYNKVKRMCGLDLYREKTIQLYYDLLK